MSKTLGQILDDLNIEVGTAMTIDWEQVRIQAAIAALPECIKKIEELISQGYFTGKLNSKQKEVAKNAISYADAIIKELKGGEE